MIRLLRKLLQTDAHMVVGIFALICAIVGVLGSQQQADQASNERWAHDGSTKYAARE